MQSALSVMLQLPTGILNPAPKCRYILPQRLNTILKRCFINSLAFALGFNPLRLSFEKHDSGCYYRFVRHKVENDLTGVENTTKENDS
jgi:hypothetical protein